MFENLKEKFDIMVSNPPYIEKKDVLTLESTVKDFEPVNALDGGEDGLDFYRIIQKKLPEFLNKNGNLFLEIGYNQGESVFNLFKESFEKAQIIKDYSNFDRIFEGINFKNI